MCFSAEASFIGAAALGVIGTAALNVPLRKQDKLWAAIPLLFAFQQLCEGIIWLDLRGSIPHSAFSVLAKDLYLFFALIFWPVWIPLSILAGEDKPLRKTFLKVLLFCGITLATFHLWSYSILEISPTVNKYSIYYFSEAPFYKKLVYLILVSLPPLISSIKYMKVFGILIILSCLISEYFYTTTFTSVWCFLGSFVSAALYMICRSNAKMSVKVG